MLVQVFFTILTVVTLKHSGGQIHFGGNHWKIPERAQMLFNNKEISRKNQQDNPYKYRYRVDDEVGNMHYHGQQKSGSGVVRGCYGYTDIKGLYRVVEYIGDKEGFRVKIHSNEPGIHRRNPANVQMGAYSSLTGLGYSYLHPCVEFEDKQTATELPGTDFATLDSTVPTEDVWTTTDLPTPDTDLSTVGEDEIYESPCYCAVEGRELKAALNRGMRLVEIITTTEGYGIPLNFSDVDETQEYIQETILRGTCHCEFLRTRSRDLAT